MAQTRIGYKHVVQNVGRVPDICHIQGTKLRETTVDVGGLQRGFCCNEKMGMLV
jgi:hypothetical protein